MAQSKGHPARLPPRGHHHLGPVVQQTFLSSVLDTGEEEEREGCDLNKIQSLPSRNSEAVGETDKLKTHKALRH